MVFVSLQSHDTWLTFLKTEWNQYLNRICDTLNISLEVLVISQKDGPWGHISMPIDYLKNFEKLHSLEAFKKETMGIATFQFVMSYLVKHRPFLPEFLQTGMADYFRLKYQLEAQNWSFHLNSWNSGYQNTARFLLWIEETHANGFVASFIFLSEFDWTEDYFKVLTDHTLSHLWDAYVDANGPRKPISWPTPFIRVFNCDPLFEKAIPNQLEWFSNCSNTIVHALYNDYQNVPYYIQSITLVVEEMDGIAHCVGREQKRIHLSTKYLNNCFQKQGFEGLVAEIHGVVFHEMVHVWQWSCDHVPGGLIEGIADYFRLKCGYAPLHWRKIATGNWDDGYDKTAYFLDWLSTKNPQFVSLLNLSLKKEWNETIFVELLGQSVHELWIEYGKSL